MTFSNCPPITATFYSRLSCNKIEPIYESSGIEKEKKEKVILFNYFTFDNFHSFERVDFFSIVVNFRC